jgi:hypothetical protein
MVREIRWKSHLELTQLKKNGNHKNRCSERLFTVSMPRCQPYSNPNTCHRQQLHSNSSHNHSHFPRSLSLFMINFKSQLLQTTWNLNRVYIYSKRENFQPYQEFSHSSDMQKTVHRLQSPPLQQWHDQERAEKTARTEIMYLPDQECLSTWWSLNF